MQWQQGRGLGVWVFGCLGGGGGGWVGCGLVGCVLEGVFCLVVGNE